MRRIVSITGSRADYGLMQPVYAAIAGSGAFELHLVVTGMHLVPEFAASLAEVRADRFGTLHDVPMTGRGGSAGDGGAAMARSLARGLDGMAVLFERLKPDMVLLQGDRGEMLAAAIAAAHMNIAVVHMSGGDRTGSIDDSLRNAISKLAHFHLTTCSASTRRLTELGEAAERIVEVGEPALDRLRSMTFVPPETLAAELRLKVGEPYLVATLHPVTDEAHHAAQQMTVMLQALADTGITSVVTHPNTDAGGQAMREVLERWRGRSFLRIEPSLGAQRYLSLLRNAAAVVGNSSSGILEAPSLKVAAINIGSRQLNRMRAGNVIDVPFDRNAISEAIRKAVHDPEFRRQVATCVSPYGDGHAAERTLDVLKRLWLGPDLIAKWRTPGGRFLADAGDAL